jgi:hypothetical protein
MAIDKTIGIPPIVPKVKPPCDYLPCKNMAGKHTDRFLSHAGFLLNIIKLVLKFLIPFTGHIPMEEVKAEGNEDNDFQDS